MTPRFGRAQAAKKPHGQIRQSQVVTTFGPGAMVDLPDHTVIIGGLETWNGARDFPIIEERLAAEVKELLGLSSVEFYAPPPDPENPNATPTGITAWEFPQWFVAQYEERNKEEGIRSRPLVHRLDLVKRSYVRDRVKYKVVPVRFVQACTYGHVTDIEWRPFVHGAGSDCVGRPLWMDERGTSGDMTAITVRCECGRAKALSAATRLDDAPLGYCKGDRPWLGPHGRERCGGENGTGQRSRLLVRSASNAYFAQTLSVISIPEAGSAIRRAIDEVWTDVLQYAESKADVTRERRKPKVSAALEAFSDADVWKEIQRRKSGEGVEARGIREVELETLLSSEAEVGNDAPGGDFYARAIKLPAKSPLAKKIDRVVKVHRLREVIAQVGFTRFEAAVSDVNGELELDVQSAALARDVTWVPAVENRGEGIFVSFRPEAVKTWLARDAVRARGKKLVDGFDAWKKDHSSSKARFPELPYVMLHSLSHLLITAVSLDCGYAASSIRERIYVSDEAYGILLYTASSDAEGTLGGLVEAADRLTDHFRQALDLARLCANDPVCAHHRPDSAEENRYLLGAACHGCVLLSEVSCERRNDFLDRALVVPTVDEAGAAFFEDEV